MKLVRVKLRKLVAVKLSVVVLALVLGVQPEVSSACGFSCMVATSDANTAWREYQWAINNTANQALIQERYNTWRQLEQIRMEACGG